VNVGELKRQLNRYADEVEVEVATCSSKDEWYEIYNLEATTNGNSRPIVVINTD
jgi:hypothetical protein